MGFGRFCGAALLALSLTAPQMAAADGAARKVYVETMTRDDLRVAVHRTAQEMKHLRRIWCVPFARAVSGINIRGDARTWWGQAGEAYPKGHIPIAGSVLTFRATGRMPLGHVAVVSQVVNERQILVDQANWVTNRITTDTMVIDVSEANDWSKVRVQNQYDSFGSVYPTHGFIYRPAATS
ncbi:CHAP domain-containing protein [Falsirhodobacter deserti]|uniref:CHAP domain-containing protein n=1 Tax=Falsirhodobacter deserti TaxID=1365611 RepID=UPI0013E3388E|nr:CHAP domain-containing protein [Falsirhodobacter deserti]